MFAPSDAMHLPLVIIDVSEHRSARPQPKRSKAAQAKAGTAPSPRPSRASRVSRLAVSIRTNVVRLIPGQTRLPFEPAAR
jgi:hypothetical protein